MKQTIPHQVEVLVHRIQPILRGRGPELQGAALADLVAMFFAGHHPALREEQITLWIECMRNLIPVNEKELFKHGDKPEGWEKQ
jgi:hypothetical protein